MKRQFYDLTLWLSFSCSYWSISMWTQSMARLHQRRERRTLEGLCLNNRTTAAKLNIHPEDDHVSTKTESSQHQWKSESLITDRRRGRYDHKSGHRFIICHNYKWERHKKCQENYFNKSANGIRTIILFRCLCMPKNIQKDSCHCTLRRKGSI